MGRFLPKIFSEMQQYNDDLCQSFRGSGGVAPLILNLCTRWRRVVNFASRLLYPPVPAENEAGKIPDPVWKFLKNVLLLQGLESQTVHARASSLYRLRYSVMFYISIAV
jgi:hypothetical protein